jgi:nucleoid-associated protein YgaU/DNA-binding SARP family transcriptional activator
MNTRDRAVAADRLTGAAAFLLLVALVVGIPVSLATLGGAATADLSWANLRVLLSGPDDGRLFLVAVVGIGWVSWLVFALSVVLEVVSVLRRVPTPRIPALRSVQHSTAALVATAGILFASGPSATTPVARPFAATAQTRPVTPGVNVASPAQVSRPTLPTIEVRRHDTLWSLAVQHLGAGERFREIVTLNMGVEQADGRALNGSHWIYPGWVLKLPPDAARSIAGQGRPDPYVVKPGDSLTEIALHELGTAQLADEVYRLNAGDVMPDGDVLTDPDLIRPGWTLELSVSHPLNGPPQPTTTHREDQVAGQDPTAPKGLPAEEVPTRAPSDSTAHDKPSGPAIVSERHEQNLEMDAALVLGLVTATGLVHELRRRRRQQQRTRRVGARIPMPQATAAAVERVAAAMEAPVTVETAAQALRALAANCGEHQRPLPDVLLVRVTPTSLRLELATDEPEATQPFVAESARMWRLAEPVNPVQQEDPYPALLTLGVDGPEMLLLNLECVGALHFVDERGDATRAALADLAVGPFSTTANLLFGEGFDDLAASLDPVRSRVLEDVTQVQREITVRHDEMADTFGPYATRSRHMSGDGMVPDIVVSYDEISVPDLAWSGVALLDLTKSGERQGWAIVVEQSGEATLLPTGLRFVPQTLTPDGFGHVVELLSTSQREPDPSPAAQEPDQRTAVGRALPEVPATLLDLRDDVEAPPRLLVLGRVEVERANDAAAPHRRRRVSELVAYLALHPGATGREIDEALWPGKRVEKSTRNPFVSRARQWLGRGPDGEPYLPLVADGGEYRLRPEVSCDWHDFVRFSQLGLDSGRPGASALAAALDLVRGRPFLGVDPATYTWAEVDVQEMISAIVDVAHVLAELRLEAGDFRGAQSAVARGLLAEPCSEVLYRDAFKAALAVGDTVELDRLSSRLRNEITLIDPDETLEDETIELLSQRAQLR